MTAHVGDRLVLDPTLPADMVGVIGGVPEEGGARPIWTGIRSGGEAHVESAEPAPEPGKVDQ